MGGLSLVFLILFPQSLVPAVLAVVAILLQGSFPPLCVCAKTYVTGIQAHGQAGALLDLLRHDGCVDNGCVCCLVSTACLYVPEVV